MGTERAFPPGITTAPAAERCTYFRRIAIAHPVLVETDRTLKRAIAQSPPGSIVLVVGPAGVGKTTMLERTESWMIERRLEEMSSALGQKPVIRLEAVSDGLRQFSWRDYYKRVLIALDEPLVNFKVDRRSRVDIPRDEFRRVLRHNATAEDLRYALELAFRHRQVEACLIDEAHHLTRIAWGRRLLDQIDTIKSLANLSGVTHVLAGNYSLLDVANLSGQLSRRSTLIHFRRYRGDSDADVHAFKRAIYTFQRDLPLQNEPDLLEFWEYLMIHSAGCVGNLKDWLTRALIESVASGEPLGIDHLQLTALSLSQCRSISAEASDGERRMLSDEGAVVELAELQGIASLSSRKKKPVSRPTVRKLLPGERRPRRDAVGKSDGK
jgi:hypothetical protein